MKLIFLLHASFSLIQARILFSFQTLVKKNRTIEE